MTRLEDALRDALAADLDVEPDAVLKEVRRGARRRRTHRRSAVVVAAVAVLVAGIALGGAVLGGGPHRVEPAPDPVRTTPPAGDAMSVSAAGDELFVTMRGEQGCRCSYLWHFAESTGWTLRSTIPMPDAYQLEMAPDARFGLVNAEGDLRLTRDGGETWEPVETGVGGDFAGLLQGAVADDRSAWVWDAITGTLHRFDGSRLRPVSFDAPGGPLDLAVADGVPVVLAADGAYTSDDDGATWERLPLPCGADVRDILAAETALYALCPPGGDATTVHRAAEPGGPWEQIGSARGILTDTVPLGDEAILLRGAAEVLVTDTGARPVTTGLGFDVMTPDAAELDGTTYLATSVGIATSPDGGRTWRPPAGTSTPSDPASADSGPRVPTAIPDDFPLESGLPTSAEPGSPGLEGPNRSLPDLELRACDTTTETTGRDRLRASFTDAAEFVGRQLTTYADADTAVVAVDAIVELYRACPSEPPGPDGYGTEHAVVRTEVGGQSWAIVSSSTFQGTYPPYVTITHVIRVGLAVLVLTTTNEGGSSGPDRDERIQGYLDDLTADAAAVVTAMCRFTAAGC